MLPKQILFHDDSNISDEIPYKSEEKMLSEPNHCRKPDVVLINDDFSGDLLFSNVIFNKFQENISEESIPGFISYIVYLHNAFASYGKLVQCEARVLNKLALDYNSSDFMSTFVHPCHKGISNECSSQCENLQKDNIVLNAHEVVTTRDDQETNPVDGALNLESNEALLSLSNSENNLQPEQHYGSRDIGRES
ncbi:unnamed protein product [Schistosoma margrebowiei]|uniref:Uncharacterized protein n=1 Tax=Schistosoma margrebowiei TaxID=48269 RepID=A0A183LPW1_9TREM|nr:unnamed protein product [Schistosoma margrebowiei]